MKVKDVMRTKVVTINPEANVKEAAKVMKTLKIGSLVVIEGNKVTGILTDGDVMRKVVAEGRNPEDVKVMEVMTQSLVTINPEAEIEEAADLMATHRIKHLIVTSDKRLVGLITASDLIAVEPKLLKFIASLISLRPSFAA